MTRLKYFKIYPETSLKDIEQQYRELAKKYHPDTQTEFSDTEKFQELQQEYQEVLKQFKQKVENSGDTKRMEQIDKLINLFAEKFVKNEKYKSLVKEGLRILLS